MVRPAEQSRPDTLRHRLMGSWLLRKWTPSQPSPTAQGEGQPLIAHDRSLLDSDALKSPALPLRGGVLLTVTPVRRIGPWGEPGFPPRRGSDSGAALWCARSGPTRGRSDPVPAASGWSALS